MASSKGPNGVGSLLRLFAAEGGTAVEDFRSRIREISGVWGSPPKSHDFGYRRMSRFFASKNPSRRYVRGVPTAAGHQPQPARPFLN